MAQPPRSVPCRPRAESRRILHCGPQPPALQLQLAATPEPPVACADPHRLQQCLTALVDNALLYTDGPVILSASSGPAGELVLHVRDRGIGLSVVRLLIEAMGGRVQVADHPGGGADFQLVLAGGPTRENTEAVGGGTGVL